MIPTPATLPIVRHPDGTHWIEPTDAVGDEPIGPYDTDILAKADRRGVIRFLQRLDAGQNPFE
jgi:hypothetical protein